MEEQIAGTALCGKKCILRVGEKWEEVNTSELNNIEKRRYHHCVLHG